MDNYFLRTHSSFSFINSSYSILGHVPQLASLQLDLNAENIAHAYLFAGPANVGKTAVAKWFAQQLLCIGRSSEETENMAHMMEKFLQPDLLVLDQLWMEDIMEDVGVIAQSSNVPQDHRRKARAKTDTIGIDDIRAIQERLHETGTGKFRCCIICSVERMQAEAVNSLLKILEEPPEGVVFLLTTNAFHSLLPTIVSRCRIIHFSRLSDRDIAPIVSDISDDDRSFILRIAQGAPGMVLRLLRDPELLRHEKQAQGNATAFWHATSMLERLQLIQPLEKRDPDADRFLLHLMLSLRQERDAAPPSAAAHLLSLQRNLDTNANRQLSVQEFVLSLGA